MARVDSREQQLYQGAAAVAEQLKIDLPEYIYQVDRQYPMIVSDYYLNLICRDELPDDPIGRQVIASAAEMNSPDWPDDGLGELNWSPVPRVIHRYPDRALLLTTGRCATHCRFCFRKRNWRQGAQLADISSDELAVAVTYLQTHNEIRASLLSGGDPLMLDTAYLQQIIQAADAIPHIEVIRIGSRLPVTCPQRFKREQVEALTVSEKVWFMTHFNHPRELTPESIACCRMLIKAGIPVFNQTVLLKGVNDDSSTLAELCHGLVKHKIKPHYLFHVDPVPGVWHFATGIKRALSIMRELRGKLSSLAMPTLAIDLPQGGGKVSLQPDYRTGDGFQTIEGAVIEHPGWNMP